MNKFIYNTFLGLVLVGMSSGCLAMDKKIDLLNKELDDECAICLEKLLPDIRHVKNENENDFMRKQVVLSLSKRFLTIKLDCKHRFCKKCINEWTSHQDSCPLCRKGGINKNLNDRKKKTDSIETEVDKVFEKYNISGENQRSLLKFVLDHAVKQAQKNKNRSL